MLQKTWFDLASLMVALPYLELKYVLPSSHLCIHAHCNSASIDGFGKNILKSWVSTLLRIHEDNDFSKLFHDHDDRYQISDLANSCRNASVKNFKSARDGSIQRVDCLQAASLRPGCLWPQLSNVYDGHSKNEFCTFEYSPPYMYLPPYMTCKSLSRQTRQ